MPIMAHLESSRSVLKLAEHICSMFPNSQALRAQCHLFAHVCPPLPSCWVTFSIFAFVYFLVIILSKTTACQKGQLALDTLITKVQLAVISHSPTHIISCFTFLFEHCLLSFWATPSSRLLASFIASKQTKKEWVIGSFRATPLDGVVHWLTTQSQGRLCARGTRKCRELYVL